jgi:hypothetical protein
MPLLAAVLPLAFSSALTSALNSMNAFLGPLTPAKRASAVSDSALLPAAAVCSSSV